MGKGQSTRKRISLGFTNSFVCPCGYAICSVLEMDGKRSQDTNKLKIKLHNKVCKISKDIELTSFEDVGNLKDKKDIRKRSLNQKGSTFQQIRCDVLDRTKIKNAQ